VLINRFLSVPTCKRRVFQPTESTHPLCGSYRTEGVNPPDGSSEERK